MAGFIIGEVLILKQIPPGPTLTAKIYFLLGFATFILAGLLGLKRMVHLFKNISSQE